MDQVKLIGREFALDDPNRTECWLASVRGKEPILYAIFHNRKFNRIVHRPPSHNSDKLIIEPAMERVKKTMNQPPLYITSLSPKKTDNTREPMNILPAFIPLAPFMISDAISDKRMDKISTGLHDSVLPNRIRWKHSGNIMYNNNLGVIVEINLENKIIKIFDGDFFQCYIPLLDRASD